MRLPLLGHPFRLLPAVSLVFWALRPSAGQINSIDRPRSPIVVTGDNLTSFLGQPTNVIRLVRFRASTGQWEPVPFQIDEMDGTGSVDGPKNGKLDADDEIVFLSADLGDSASADRWPADEESKRSVRVKIAVEDPLAPAKKGWVYAVHSSSLSKSDVRYVHYTPAEDRVVTGLYEIGHGALSGFQESVLIPKSAGGDGVNFLDRQKLRLKLHVSQVDKDIVLKEQMDEDVELITGFSIHMTVKKKRVSVSGDPVIRLNRTLVIEIKAAGSFLGYNVGFDDSLRFASAYYPEFSVFRSGQLPVPQVEQGDMKELRLSSDLNSNAIGMVFTNTYNRSGARIDGVPSATDNTLLWPGLNGYLIAANPDDPRSVLKSASVVGIWDLRGSPVGTAWSLYFKDFALTDRSDTGDRKSYGDAGIQTSSGKLSGILDFENSMYYVPADIGFSEAEGIMGRHSNPLSAEGAEERRVEALTIRIDPPGAGAVTIGPWPSAYADSTVVLTAAANPGFVFSGWLGDLSGPANPASLVMDRPRTVTAYFKGRFTITLNTDPSGRYLIVDGGKIKGPSAFVWTEGDSHMISADSVQTGGGLTRYLFSSWSDGGERSHAYTVPARDDNLVLKLGTQYFIRTAVIPNKTGTMKPEPPGSWFDKGAQVTLEAVSAAEYAFINWSGSVSGSLNPAVLLMDGPKTVKANFGNLPPVLSVRDTSFAEDDTLKFTFRQLNQWVEDPNNADSTLTFRFSGGNRFQILADSARGRIEIFTRLPDWNGRDSIAVFVTDPMGSSDSAKIVITVIPVPDPPGPFALTSPEDGNVLSNWPATVDFSWEPSFDPDAGDTVTYVFQLDTTSVFGSPRCIRIPGIRQNRYSLAWPKSYGDREYFWTVTAVDQTRLTTKSDRPFTLRLATGIGENERKPVPSTFVLNQNYPNPFNGETAIIFGLPRPGRVSLSIFNSHGQRIGALAEGDFREGYHTIHWDGKDAEGKRLPTGIYVIQIAGDGFRISKKAILLQ
jgi:hypothetical protein